MKNIKYPPKPWNDGDVASLVPGLYFMYSSSVKNWIPITPGYDNKEQISSSFDNETVSQLVTITNSLKSKTQELESELSLSGRIWKSATRPTYPGINDVWIDLSTGRFFSYYETKQTWIEI